MASARWTISAGRTPARFFAAAVVAVQLAVCAPTTALAQTPDAFARLATGYARRDPAMAADAYAPSARLTYRYPRTPVEVHDGRDAIRRSFAALFNQVPADRRLDLDFRLRRRDVASADGIYRLRVGRHAQSFGSFHVTFDTDGRFQTDESGPAAIADFESLPGPTLVRPDDAGTDRAYYSALTGRYRLPGGCVLVVTRSSVRLFVRDTCTGQWRGMTRVSGLKWTTGATIIPAADTRPTATYRFARPERGAAASVAVTDASGSRSAIRVAAYRQQEVAFAAHDGTRLAGTLYRPARPRGSAVVMVHGSGPQDRDGYASIIAVMADALAAAGRTVLAYDKRGSGGSEGDGAHAGFDLLAADARAAMAFLATQPGVARDRIGLAGSSQAGWVVAQAIADGAAPRDIFLLGAAGTAMTVAEQNAYNTRVRMLCAGIAADAVTLAIDQQRAFFAALKDPAQAARLDAVTARARAVPALADWLFPDSSGLGVRDGSWYTVLDPSFDPLPVWRRYRGNASFVFSEHDDATDTALVVDRLRGVPGSVAVLGGAQHLGLRTDDRCHGDLAALSAFARGLFAALDRFGRGGPVVSARR